MERIDRHEVLMTEEEVRIRDLFNEILDEGKTIAQAAMLAFANVPAADPEFVLYLSDGCCTVEGGDVVLTDLGRRLHPDVS